MAIIQMIMAPYLATSFAPGTVLFETMAQVETGLRQVNMTDLEFLYKLANDWGCTFDVRPVAAINRLTFFFVDDSSDGDLLIGALQPDRNIMPVYKMDWRDGLKNVSSLKFSGEASSRGDRGGVLRRSDTGEMETVDSAVVGVVDEHDPANWELDQSKVDKWIREHPNSSMDDFYRMAFSMPIPAMHAAFFTRKTVQRFGTPVAPDSQDRSGLGAGGFKCDFELVRGDPFLEPNTPVDLGGDVYSRYKSYQVSIGRDVVSGGTSRFVPHTTGMLYWRVAQVTHSFGPDGLKTKGVLKR